MKDEIRSNGKKTDKKPVTYTTVDWDSYRIKKVEKDAHAHKRGKDEWHQPVVDEKWLLDKEDDPRHAYDFAADEEFNKALKEADSKKEKPAYKAADEIKEIKAEDLPADRSEKKEEKKTVKKEEKQAEKPEEKQEKKQVEKKTDRPEDKPVDKQENKPEKDAAAKTRKKKSLGTKLDELGSSWVSTGNFRNRDELDNKTIDDLEKNIIETTKGASDDFLTMAVAEVSSALRDENGYEPLGEVSLADTFEIPKLDIHFGDTQDLKEEGKDLKEIRSEDLKKEIEKLDLAADADSRKKAEKKPEKVTGKKSEKTAEETAEKRTKKRAEKTAEEKPEKTAEETAGKRSGKRAEKTREE